MEHKTKRMT